MAVGRVDADDVGLSIDERLDALIDGEPDPNARIMAASVLFNYFNWCTKGESAGELVARTEPLLARPDVAPLMQLWWRTHLAFWHYVNGRYERSQAVSDEARTIAERYGLTTYLFEIDHAEASALVTRGALAEAQARMALLEARLSPSRRMDHAYFHYLKANLEQRLGHFTAAVRAAERAVALARETGLPAMQVPHFLVRLAHAGIAAGDTAAGLHALDEAIALAPERPELYILRSDTYTSSVGEAAWFADLDTALGLDPDLRMLRSALGYKYLYLYDLDKAEEIGQGLVDQALSQRPEERRRLFEEAAGITVHQAKRDQASHNLDDATTNLTGYVHGARFGAAAAGVSLGRCVNSLGHEDFVSLLAPTLGTTNARPRVGPVVISEIMFQPPLLGADQDYEAEFIELQNVTATNVPLQTLGFPSNTWRLGNARGFST